MTITAIAPENGYPTFVKAEDIGRKAEKVHALKQHWCAECPEEIKKDTSYYSVTVIGNKSHIPHRTCVHLGCLKEHFEHIRRSRGI